MANAHILIRDPRAERVWAWGRLAALAGVAALLLGLFALPGLTLATLWYVVVPVLPATFFISPAIWRGICPLATLNEWGNRIGMQRALSRRGATVLGVGGLVLFHLMVPARRLAFNTDGPLLAATVIGVALLALGLGIRFEQRSAFCNALCPVLPVERLYGLRPLLDIGRGRCATCTVCTPTGCLDLAAHKAATQLLGARRHTAAWLATPWGAFAAALPGFIVGYNLVPDGPVTTAAAVYAATLGGSLASLGLTALVVFPFRIRAAVALPTLAALAGAIYYWFAGAATATALALPEAAAWAIRVAGIGLVAAWTVAPLLDRWSWQWSR